MIGGRSGPALSRMHATVALAERIHAEDQGLMLGYTDASTSFRQSGDSKAQLFEDAGAIGSNFVLGGWLFGIWMGLALGLKLVAFSLRRRRTDYEADRGSCLACARCYEFCPQEHPVEQEPQEGFPV